MSGIIWNTFIALHSSDILRKLNKEVNVLLLFPLPRSNFDHTQQFWERYKGFKIQLDILEEGLTRDICCISPLALFTVPSPTSTSFTGLSHTSPHSSIPLERSIRRRFNRTFCCFSTLALLPGA